MLSTFSSSTSSSTTVSLGLEVRSNNTDQTEDMAEDKMVRYLHCVWQGLCVIVLYRRM